MDNPSALWTALELGLAIIILFNVVVSVRLHFYAGISWPQKTIQLLIIWLVPLIGALMVNSINFPRRQVGEKFSFTPDGGDNPPGIGTGGGHS